MFSPKLSIKFLLLSNLTLVTSFLPNTKMQNIKNECTLIKDTTSYPSLKSNLRMLQESTLSNRKAKKGDIVTIDYTLTPSGDFVTEPLFDTHGKVTFVLDGGNYLPGIHELLLGMTIGTSVENVDIDAGWGDRNPELVFQVPKSSVQGLDFNLLKVGMELYLQSNKVIVSKVEDEYIEIDANPPLAGASYTCSLKLLDIEDAPKVLEYIPSSKETYGVATFALGCFWGGELAYMREPGVVGTKVGYTQGRETDPIPPNYEMVCSGETCYAEAIQILYNPKIVSYERLVNLAIERLGDSLYSLNQVGNDVGTQYRSGIYYHTDEQKDIAKKLLAGVGERCVTELLPAGVFYDAEEYHQQYLLKGGQSAKKNAKEFIRCYG